MLLPFLLHALFDLPAILVDNWLVVFFNLLFTALDLQIYIFNSNFTIFILLLLLLQLPNVVSKEIKILGRNDLIQLFFPELERLRVSLILLLDILEQRVLLIVFKVIQINWLVVIIHVLVLLLLPLISIFTLIFLFLVVLVLILLLTAPDLDYSVIMDLELIVLFLLPVVLGLL